MPDVRASLMGGELPFIAAPYPTSPSSGTQGLGQSEEDHECPFWLCINAIP